MTRVISSAIEGIGGVRRARICFTRGTTTVHTPAAILRTDYGLLTSVSPCIFHAILQLSSFPFFLAPLFVRFRFSLRRTVFPSTPVAGHVPCSFSLFSFSSLPFLVVFVEHRERRDPANTALASSNRPQLSRCIVFSYGRTTRVAEAFERSRSFHAFRGRDAALLQTTSTSPPYAFMAAIFFGIRERESRNGRRTRVCISHTCTHMYTRGERYRYVYAVTIYGQHLRAPIQT